MTVKLRNRGQDAFKPDVYGRSIIIERRLTKEGSGSYKLKNADGKVVSNKREELSHIMDQFNIQVDNPVSILNQDTSRCFINSKSPYEKYKVGLPTSVQIDFFSAYTRKLGNIPLKCIEGRAEKKLGGGTK